MENCLISLSPPPNQNHKDYFSGILPSLLMTEEELQQHWQRLENLIATKTGALPSFDDILLYIGKLESGMPPKELNEKEKTDLIQMATCTVLVPARYYQLFWVEDTGWPHYKELQRLPPMPREELELLLKPWIIQYVVKNRIL
jgi:hypothetical protein